MGKFTDDFFMFPIKIYDGFSLRKALKEEEDEFNSAPVPIDWVTGFARIPGRDLDKLMWHDGFSRDRSVESVAQEGFDTTVVISDIYGEFISTWPRKKFEAKLDEFMEKWRASLPQINLPFISFNGLETPPHTSGTTSEGTGVTKD